MVFLELWRDSRVTTGNSGFLFNWPREVQFSFELRVRTGDCSPVTAGQNRHHLRLCPGSPCLTFTYSSLYIFFSFLYVSNKFQSQLLGKLKVRHFYLTEGETEVYKSYFYTFTQLLPGCGPRRLSSWQERMASCKKQQKLDFPGGSVDKNLPANAEDMGSLRVGHD